VLKKFYPDAPAEDFEDRRDRGEDFIKWLKKVAEIKGDY
jgi:hypothetical protein